MADGVARGVAAWARTAGRWGDGQLVRLHEWQRTRGRRGQLAWWALATPLALAAWVATRHGWVKKAGYGTMATFGSLLLLGALVAPPAEETDLRAGDAPRQALSPTTTERSTTTTEPSTTTTTTTTLVVVTTTAPTTTTTVAPPTTTARAAAAPTTATTRRPATTTTARPATTTSTTRAAPAGTCSASVDNARPTTNQTVRVYVSSNVASTTFTAVAHYKTKDTTQTGGTDGSGNGSVAFRTATATSGYTVRIDVNISGRARCSTSFTPQ